MLCLQIWPTLLRISSWLWLLTLNCYLQSVGQSSMTTEWRSVCRSWHCLEINFFVFCNENVKKTLSSKYFQVTRQYCIIGEIVCTQSTSHRVWFLSLSKSLFRLSYRMIYILCNYRPFCTASALCLFHLFFSSFPFSQCGKNSCYSFHIWKAVSMELTATYENINATIGIK